MMEQTFCQCQKVISFEFWLNSRVTLCPICHWIYIICICCIYNQSKCYRNCVTILIWDGTICVLRGRRKSPQNHIETKFVGFIITQNTIIEKKKPVSAPTTHIQQFALSTRLHSNGKFVRHGKWNDWILKFVFGLFWIFVIFICCLVLLRNIHMFYNVVEKKLILHHLCSNSTPVRLCKTFGSIFRKSMNTQM